MEYFSNEDRKIGYKRCLIVEEILVVLKELHEGIISGHLIKKLQQIRYLI